MKKNYLEMSNKYGKLQQNYTRLQKEMAEVRKENSKLKEEMAELRKENAKLKAKNKREDLERQQYQMTVMENSVWQFSLIGFNFLQQSGTFDGLPIVKMVENGEFTAETIMSVQLDHQKQSKVQN